MNNISEILNEDREKESFYYFLLSNCLNVGYKTYKTFMNTFSSPREMFEAGDEKRAACNAFNRNQLAGIRKVLMAGDMYENYMRMAKKGISYICCEDPLFPQKLKELHDCPLGLFYIGRIPFQNVASIGLIGARECSFYGEEMAKEIGSCLGDYNLQVISGMARGVDSLGQTACLDAGGLSFAVLGGGVDICYPRESRRLYDRLINCGGIISEYPPGIQPQGMYFVRRNRIISGLSDVVCVIEAKKKSGTLITVDCALEQGRDVIAVPGKVTDVTSRGCNELIAQGARILTDVDEFASECASTYGSLDGNICLTKENSKGELPPLTALQKELVLRASDDSFMVTDFLTDLQTDYGNMLLACLDLCDRKLLINIGAGRFRLSSKGLSMRETVQSLEMSKKN